MSLAELVIILAIFSALCLVALFLVTRGSPIGSEYHDDLSFVWISALLFLAFFGASYAYNFDSRSGLEAAARTAVFSAFAFVMAIRRCRKKETSISGSFFLVAAGFIIFTLARMFV